MRLASRFLLACALLMKQLHQASDLAGQWNATALSATT